jgi:CheY-like chemotaxis protein/anti-sigma regulatory factor (Ser/Thr protein kinase)
MLLQSEKLKSLGELAGGVAHDFNNVLAAILGRVQLLRMNLEKPSGGKERRKGVLELEKGLEIIEKASLDGAETVRRIQEFSRRRTDDKNITQVDINDLIRNALEFTRVRWKNEAESRGIQIKIRKELSSLPPIAGSASELREVFTNLINNAIDAMPQGGEIGIKTFKKNSHVSVELEDTGIGIPDTIRDRIFDPFFTTKGPQSTGLGMSVSYGIINRHGGTIKVKSVEGNGTSFTIQLPLSRETIEGGREKKPIRGKSKKARILVVEDKKEVCEVLKDILVNGGHEVETVPDGSEGVKLFKKKDFHLVFTDLGMPTKSGWQVAKEVKKINKNTPVALITGWEVQLDRSKLKKSGVDLVINKPFKVDQVLRLVQEGMELKRVPRGVKRK